MYLARIAWSMRRPGTSILYFGTAWCNLTGMFCQKTDTLNNTLKLKIIGLLDGRQIVLESRQNA